MKKLIPGDAVLIPGAAQRVFAGEIFDVYQWPQALYDGTEATFEMLKRPDTVVAICVLDDGDVLVLDDEQPVTGSRHSFPSGRVDADDTDTEAAIRREVAEETGYSFKNWRLLSVRQPHSKIEWFVHLWLAWGTDSQQPQHLDAGEKITVHELPFAEVKQLVINKSGYLGETIDLFAALENAEQLLTLPAFSGREVDR